MKLLFSEAPADCAHYTYPYAVWALPEPGETPADLFECGFLPSSAKLDRFYLCRNIRVELARYRPSSENRRVLRKGDGLAARLVPRSQFDFAEDQRSRWLGWAERLFGAGVMPPERLDRLMYSSVVNHILVFDHAGTEIGSVLLYLEPPRLGFYYFGFYDPDGRGRSLGMFMMTHAVGHFAGVGYRHLHLGSCYSESALYKTQFEGAQFFNGNRWSANMEELKYLVRRTPQGSPGHLLESEDYLRRFAEGSVAGIEGIRIPSAGVRSRGS